MLSLPCPRRENGQLARLSRDQPQLVDRIAREGRHVQVAAVDTEPVVAVGGCRPPVPSTRGHGLQPLADLLGRTQVAARMLAALTRKFHREFEIVVRREHGSLPMQRQREQRAAANRPLADRAVFEQLRTRHSEPDDIGLAAAGG